MDAEKLAVTAWTIAAGLAGETEPELLRSFCERARAAGLPVAIATVVIDTLHPVHEGRVFRWRREAPEKGTISAYGRSDSDDEAAASWQSSTFRHLLVTGQSSLRRRIGPGHPADFPVLEDLAREGQADYLALIHRFSPAGAIGEMDCIYSSWATDRPSGFTDAELDALRETVAPLALALKAASLQRIAETLVETYLGRDAGHRVLKGKIARGVTEKISAVVWLSDIRGFTRLTETAAPEDIIPFLNDYAEATITSIHEFGGDVLKLMGDGILAIFRGEPLARACGEALSAERRMRERLQSLDRERRAKNLSVGSPYVGLHVGDVFYGNIGSHDRLDFTVVGPAVNEASRICGLCRSVERDLLVSSALHEAASEADRAQLVSVGRYALRGIDRPQHLYTREPEAEPSAGEA
ncbi:MAG TPA: adenylate/guanylate cyclase domain-containing protein [Paracoccaceae bacterium]|nr:adenylate/guanylate cyclase domain-containing protein [Paracoccaceae bacterium]